MKITEHTPLFQSLQTDNPVQSVPKTEKSAAISAEISPEESLVLHALNPATWLSTRLVVSPETNSQAQEIEFELPQREKLLNSLKLAELNVEAAQNFVSEVDSLLSDLRSQYGLPEQSQAYLLIVTAQETFKLDPLLLDPQALFSAFSAAKAQLSPQELQANHSVLADLAAQAVAGMRSELNPNEMPALSPDLLFAPDRLAETPEAFLRQLQLFQVPSREALLQSWLNQVPDNPGEDTGFTGATLSSETEELIRRANALEEGLNLAPKPNSPDIVELFRAFIQIFKDLDLALNAIAAHLDYKRKEKAQFVADFGEQLQASMRLTREKLDQLRLEAHEELREGLELLKKQLGFQAALLCQPGSDPAPTETLLLALKRLQDWALNQASG